MAKRTSKGDKPRAPRRRRAAPGSAAPAVPDIGARTRRFLQPFQERAAAMRLGSQASMLAPAAAPVPVAGSSRPLLHVSADLHADLLRRYSPTSIAPAASGEAPALRTYRDMFQMLSEMGVFVTAHGRAMRTRAAMPAPDAQGVAAAAPPMHAGPIGSFAPPVAFDTADAAAAAPMLGVDLAAVDALLHVRVPGEPASGGRLNSTGGEPLRARLANRGEMAARLARAATPLTAIGRAFSADAQGVSALLTDGEDTPVVPSFTALPEMYALAASLQRKAAGGPAPLSARVQAVQQASLSRGQALPLMLRRTMEGALGGDFGGVRVHTDGAAASAASAVQARAFALGSDLYFAPGAYNPNSPAGLALLGHELTHTLQWVRTRQPGTAGEHALPALEAEALAVESSLLHMFGTPRRMGLHGMTGDVAMPGPLPAGTRPAQRLLALEPSIARYGVGAADGGSIGTSAPRSQPSRAAVDMGGSGLGLGALAAMGPLLQRALAGALRRAGRDGGQDTAGAAWEGTAQLQPRAGVGQDMPALWPSLMDGAAIGTAHARGAAWAGTSGDLAAGQPGSPVAGLGASTAEGTSAGIIRRWFWNGSGLVDAAPTPSGRLSAGMQPGVAGTSLDARSLLGPASAVFSALGALPPVLHRLRPSGFDQAERGLRAPDNAAAAQSPAGVGAASWSVSVGERTGYAPWSPMPPAGALAAEPVLSGPPLAGHLRGHEPADPGTARAFLRHLVTPGMDLRSRGATAPAGGPDAGLDRASGSGTRFLGGSLAGGRLLPLVLQRAAEHARSSSTRASWFAALGAADPGSPVLLPLIPPGTREAWFAAFGAVRSDEASAGPPLWLQRAATSPGGIENLVDRLPARGSGATAAVPAFGGAGAPGRVGDVLSGALGGGRLVPVLLQRATEHARPVGERWLALPAGAAEFGMAGQAVTAAELPWPVADATLSTALTPPPASLATGAALSGANAVLIGPRGAPWARAFDAQQTPGVISSERYVGMAHSGAARSGDVFARVIDRAMSPGGGSETVVQRLPVGDAAADAPGAWGADPARTGAALAQGWYEGTLPSAGWYPMARGGAQLSSAFPGGGRLLPLVLQRSAEHTRRFGEHQPMLPAGTGSFAATAQATSVVDPGPRPVLLTGLASPPASMTTGSALDVHTGATFMGLDGGRWARTPDALYAPGAASTEGPAGLAHPGMSRSSDALARAIERTVAPRGGFESLAQPSLGTDVAAVATAARGDDPAREGRASARGAYAAASPGAAWDLAFSGARINRGSFGSGRLLPLVLHHTSAPLGAASQGRLAGDAMTGAYPWGGRPADALQPVFAQTAMLSADLAQRTLEGLGSAVSLPRVSPAEGGQRRAPEWAAGASSGDAGGSVAVGGYPLAPREYATGVLQPLSMPVQGDIALAPGMAVLAERLQAQARAFAGSSAIGSWIVPPIGRAMPVVGESRPVARASLGGGRLMPLVMQRTPAQEGPVGQGWTAPRTDSSMYAVPGSWALTGPNTTGGHGGYAAGTERGTAVSFGPLSMAASPGAQAGPGSGMPGLAASASTPATARSDAGAVPPAPEGGFAWPWPGAGVAADGWPAGIGDGMDRTGETVLGRHLRASRSLAVSTGQALPLMVQRTMSTVLGADFSSVRVHTDQAAADAARTLDARAFAHGRNLYFAPGVFDPGSAAGLALIGHELVHTLQGAGMVQRKALGGAVPLLQAEPGHLEAQALGVETALHAAFSADAAQPMSSGGGGSMAGGAGGFGAGLTGGLARFVQRTLAGQMLTAGEAFDGPAGANAGDMQTRDGRSAAGAGTWRRSPDLGVPGLPLVASGAGFAVAGLPSLTAARAAEVLAGPAVMRALEGSWPATASANGENGAHSQGMPAEDTGALARGALASNGSAGAAAAASSALIHRLVDLGGPSSGFTQSLLSREQASDAPGQDPFDGDSDQVGMLVSGVGAGLAGLAALGPTIQRRESGAPATAGANGSHSYTADGAAHATGASAHDGHVPTGPDLDALAEQVIAKIKRELALDHDRTGGFLSNLMR